MNYTPRLTPPSTSDKRWLQINYGGYNQCIVGADGPPSVLPNCTGYVHGRWMELANINTDNLGLSFGNAVTYYTDSDSTLIRSSTAQLGAVAVWSDIGGGPGHVAIVEEIKDNGDIITSNSDYYGVYFYTQQVYASDGYALSGKTFLGFVLHPNIQPIPPHPPIINKKKGYKFILFNRRKRLKNYG